MSPLLNAAALHKGALVKLEPAGRSTAFVFQYNPEKLVRQLGPGIAGEELRLSFDLDAADALERGDPQARELGLLPALAALHLLLMPRPAADKEVAAGTAGTGLGASAEAQAAPGAGRPALIFAWGPHRQAPVRVVDCSITEEAFDAALQPIRARVDLTLRVLSAQECAPDDPAYGRCLAYWKDLERLAGQYRPERDLGYPLKF